METANETSYPRFLRLPTEILSLMFGHLYGWDLKNIQLCCSFPKPIAEIILFDELIVVLHEVSVKGRMDISEYTTLGNYVEHISYESR